MEYICFNQTGDISLPNGGSLKLKDKVTYLVRNVSSTENNVSVRLAKAWTAIDRLSILRNSNIYDEIKRNFYQAAVVSVLIYGCTTWKLPKRIEKKLDGNRTRMLRNILNKSWKQHPTKQQLFGHQHPISRTIQIRRTRHAGHCWRSKNGPISDVVLWTPSQILEDQFEHIYRSSVRTQDVIQRISRKRWIIDTNGKRESGKSILTVRHDVDEYSINLFVQNEN